METKNICIFRPLAEGSACGKALLLAIAKAHNTGNAEQWCKALHAAYIDIQAACDAYMTALRYLITDNDQRTRTRFIQCEAALEAANTAACEMLGRDTCYTAPLDGDITMAELFKALSGTKDNDARPLRAPSKLKKTFKSYATSSRPTIQLDDMRPSDAVGSALKE